MRATSNEVDVTDDWPEAIWVAAVCSRSVVHRIDPVTNRIVARIALPGRAGFSGVALGLDAVWAAPSGQVVRIDSDVYERGTPPGPQQPGGEYIYIPRNDLWACTRTR